jgi:type VI secretion system protein ImpM
VPDAGDRPADDAAYAGFFGKIPAAGDFVARGLSPAFRKAWDLWVTRHLIPLLDGEWPAGGLRFRLASGGRVAAGVVVPSADAAGRRFPLSLVVIAPGLPLPEALDPWCDAALAAAGPSLLGQAGPDDLWAALEALDVPEVAAEGPGLALWRRGEEAEECAPDGPEEALGRVFG